MQLPRLLALFENRIAEVMVAHGRDTTYVQEWLLSDSYATLQQLTLSRLLVATTETHTQLLEALSNILTLTQSSSATSTGSSTSSTPSTTSTKDNNDGETKVETKNASNESFASATSSTDAPITYSLLIIDNVTAFHWVS
jgi:hypothetical protein